MLSGLTMLTLTVACPYFFIQSLRHTLRTRRCVVRDPSPKNFLNEGKILVVVVVLIVRTAVSIVFECMM